MEKNAPVMEEEESEELAAKLSSTRQANNEGIVLDDVVFGNLSISVKDVKSFRANNLVLSLRVVYPKVYQTAIPVQETNKPIGHTFHLHNVTTEGMVVLEFFKGLVTLRALSKINKALSKRVGVVKIPVNKIASGDSTSWMPIKSDKEVTDFGVPQLQISMRFDKKTSVGIDDFELLKLLGRGKFGKVFMCTQKATGKVYAIKMIRKQDLNSNAVDIHHTLVERLILSSVEHPFICNLKFAFQDSEKVYFVLQYIEGGELMYHVHSQGKPLELARVVFYAAELVLALEYLHSRNVIYRDLKPENIMIDKDGHVRLTDFGLSKIAKDKTHSICGTPQFLAPEMILYAKTTGYNRMVDWWALGVVIHEMASCQLPFDDENHQQLYRKIVYEQPVFPSYFGGEIVDLLSGFLTKDPNKRLGQSVDDIRNHPFFVSINWVKLEAKELEPPFVPKLKKPTDTAYFYKSFTTADKKDSVALISVADETQERFRNFSFTNLTELTGDAAADGSIGGVPPEDPALNLPADDELRNALAPVKKVSITKQPDFVVTHKNPLLSSSAGNLSRVSKLLTRDDSALPEVRAPPTQLSVHPWPQLMTEAPEHSSWGNLVPPGGATVSDAEAWWGSAQEPSQVVAVGRLLVAWVEEAGSRLVDPGHSYVFVDAARKRVGLWHGADSTPIIRGRATRLALMMAQELPEHNVALCPSNVVTVKPEVHSAPARIFPRSLQEARDASSFGPDVVPLYDGRRSAFVWLASGIGEGEAASAAKREFAGKPFSVEREGQESAIFRGHFRLLWGPTGDVALRKGKAKRRFAARRPFEANCNVGDKISVLGEGEVPHWCYILDTTTGSRGIVPLGVLLDSSEDPQETVLVSPRSQSGTPSLDEEKQASGSMPVAAGASSSSSTSAGSVGGGNNSANSNNSSPSDASQTKVSRLTRTGRSQSQTQIHDHISKDDEVDASAAKSPRSPRDKDSDTPKVGKVKTALSTMRQSRQSRKEVKKPPQQPSPVAESPSFPGIRLRVVEEQPHSSSPSPLSSARSEGGDSASGGVPARPKSPKASDMDNMIGSPLLALASANKTFVCSGCESIFPSRGLLLAHLHAAASNPAVCASKDSGEGDGSLEYSTDEEESKSEEIVIAEQ